MSIKKKVWIDTDLSVGMKRYGREGYSDVDDGYAILQLFYSETIDIKGISSVFGNTMVENAFSLAEYMCQHFAPYRIPVFFGSGSAMQLRDIRTNQAVEALAQALRKEKMTIMAIGPATNIGILLTLYPELEERIDEIVLVAGRRRSQDHFSIGNQGSRARDLNFDLDNISFEVIYQSDINVTLCPFEISNKVWLTKKDLVLLSENSPGTQWLSKHSYPWLEQWVDQGAVGFNPFDVLASHYLISPEDIISESLYSRLEIHKDDTSGIDDKTTFKKYLVCDRGIGNKVRYCYDVVPDYHEKLMRSMLKN